MVVLSFNAGGSRASTLHTITCLVGFFASLASAAPSQQVGHPLRASRLNARAETLEACLSAAGITTSLPASETWSNDTLAWNSRLSPVPSAVIFPTTEEEVTAALQCASATGTKVTTLGGNRSFSSMGFGRNDGALIVNLVKLKVLKYDESTELLTYGGPVMISEAANLMWNDYGRTLPHGRCPDVGLTGVAAAGFGTLSRAAGTVLDNVVGVRVAVANGSIYDASADVNADLYWGVRGAASSMGVVLQYHLKTLEVPSKVVTSYTIGFLDKKVYTPTQQDNVDALLGIQKWAQSEDNNDLVSVRFSLSTNATMAGFFYGTTEEWATVSASILKYLPSQMSINSEEFEFWDSEDVTTPGIKEKTITARRYFYIASVTIPESAPLDNATAWSLFSNTAYATKMTDASASGFVDIWGGAYTNSLSSDTSAWKHDGNLLLIRWDIRSSKFDVSFADTTIDKMRENFYTFVDAYKAAGGSPGGFTTYRDERWSIDETAAYLYGDNWEKLQQVKTEFDPTEMFNTDPQAVPALA